MNVEIRVYKRFDMDLLALHDCGFSLTKMMKDALIHYANGKPYHLYIDEYIPFNLTDKKSVRLRLSIPDADIQTKQLLHGLKQGCRSNFCKLVLRNAFLQQNLVCYLKDNNLMNVHQANALSIPFGAMQGVYMVSQYRMQREIIQVAGIVKDVTPKNTGMKKAPKQTKQKEFKVSAAPQAGINIPTMPVMKPAVVPNIVQPINEQVQEQRVEVPRVQNIAPAPPSVVDTKDIKVDIQNMPDVEPTGDIDEDNNIVPGLAGDDELMKAFDAL